MKRMVSICARCLRFHVSYQSTVRSFPSEKRIEQGLDMDRYMCKGVVQPFMWVEDFFGLEVPENCVMVAEYAVSA